MKRIDLSEAKRSVRTEFLGYYMCSPKHIRQAAIAILPGTKPSELDFLVNNHDPALIHCFENKVSRYVRLLRRAAKLSPLRKINVYYGDMFEKMLALGIDYGAIWADTEGFLDERDANLINTIICHHLLPKGIFALTVARDGYRGHKNYRFDESLLDPKTLLKVKFSGGASPMAFIVGRKR